MKKALGVSIIITSYNQGKYLREALLSVLKQPIKIEYEIIVVDDGSTDSETINALNFFEGNPNTIIVRLQHHGRQGPVRNVGLERAKYNYIFMMDGDDLLSADPHTLRKGTYVDRALAHLENNNSLAFVRCATRMCGMYSGFTNSSYPITEAQVIRKHHVSTWIIYRKSEAIGAGCYDPDIKKWTDWSFAVSLLNYRLKQGKRRDILFLPEAYYLYRIYQAHRESAGAVDEEEMIRTTFERQREIFLKYYPNISSDLIPHAVLAHKPSKIKDLFFMSLWNPLAALESIQKRGLKAKS